jgi:hypothetical protein
MIQLSNMQDVVKTRLFLFLMGLVIVPVLTVLLILFAKGYRPDIEKREIRVTGILAIQSHPENSSISLNGKPLTTVTDTSLNLDPGQYEVEVSKEGYITWKKTLAVQPEIVTSITATLFPSVPTLKPITSLGATTPSLSPDGSKVAYVSLTNRREIYTLDLNESPLGLLNRESRLLTTLPGDTKNQSWKLSWSPDSRQVLAITSANSAASPSAYLIDSGNQQITNVSATLARTLDGWKQRQKIEYLQKFSTLPDKLKELLATCSADLSWSPKENRLMYTATASASLPDQVKPQLPGSSTQPQSRDLTPGSVYVYDFEEDRNFKIDQIPPTPTPKKGKSATVQCVMCDINANWRWFPTSAHLYRVEGNKIVIIEYDRQNPTTVYTGPLAETTVFPYPSGKQMLIITNLNTTPTPELPSLPNLYALNLK